MSSTTGLSLAQQIALLEEAAPVDIDPEDAHVRDPDAEDVLGTDPAAREHYLEVGPSTLRKQHDSVSDPKYEGVKTTRRQMMEESDDGGEDGDEEGEGEGEDGGSEESEREYVGMESEEIEGNEGEKDEDEDMEEPASSGSEEDDADSRSLQKQSPTKRPAPVGKPPEEATEDFSSTLRQKRDEDRKKGKAVARQIALWDSLLNARIRLQKSLVAVNRLPKPLELKEYASMPECQESMGKLLSEAAGLSDELFELQEYLLDSNESITAPPRKRRKIESSDEMTNYSQWFQDATSDLASFEERSHPHLVQTLTKWSAKIQAVAPSILLPSNRNAFSAKSSQHTKSIMQLIDDTLSDHDKILARTQLRRGQGRRIGVSVEDADEQGDQADPEVFDDTDFYQQLLRSVIDSRGNGLGEDWLAVQKQKKAKKKVDTKASKGRKLRYEVHEKLQNFMVSVPVIGGWHEEQIDELFASILGKGFENALPNGDNDDSQEPLNREVNESLKDGFRVFG